MRRQTLTRAAAALLAGAMAGLLYADFAATPAHAADLPVPERGAALPLEPDRLLPWQTRLGFNLVQQLAQSNPSGNIVVSPASIAAVLALLDLGADARMRAAIHRTLGFAPRHGRSSATDLERLRATVARFEGGTGPLLTANTIVFDPVSKPHTQALTRLRAAGADARVEDLSQPETIKRINDWVATHTKGLIPLILEGAPRDPGLVALNALYFKDRWRTPFDPKATRNAPFHPLEGEPIEVPMMRHTEGSFRFRQDERFVAVDLSYGTEGFSIVVVTSKSEPVPAPAFAAVATWLTGEGFAQAPGEVSLPRFALSESAELLGALDALGLKAGRLSPTALFGFSAVPQSIARVIQKTMLRVDEAGTEALAATAVVTTRSAPLDFVKIVVNKPFVFALRDAQTGMVVMAGYIGRPRADG